MTRESYAPCVVCDATSRFELTHERYTLLACNDRTCGHRFVHPMPSDDELAAVYETPETGLANADGWVIAEDYANDPDAIRDYYTKHRIDWLRKSVPGMSDKQSAILDVGCSTGVMLRVLKDKGYTHLYGLELSESARTYVETEHGIPCVANIADLEDESFDVILCWEVVEHVSDPLDFVGRLSPKLKTGGTMMILVPNYMSLYRYLFSKSWLWLIPPIHLQYFGVKSMKRLLDAAGLEPVRIDTGYHTTYLYLVLYHLLELVGRQMPSTTRTKRSAFMSRAIEWTERSLRIILLPGRVFAKATNLGCELRCIALRPVRNISTVRSALERTI
jgi:2-polyprenyl-3-methyl-5-hydroxy-6-metoxy-1,4-benzoquinol methylase